MDYRYGFNGKEKDDELSSGDYDFGARIYDSRLGRWLACDPSKQYSSPFIYSGDSPVLLIDPDGKWSVSNHYKLTSNVLLKYGISMVQNDLLSHYASVFADHPPKKILLLNNLLHNDGQAYRNRAFGIQYTTTEKSQDIDWVPGSSTFNHKIWHSMRSNQEKAAGSISEEHAMERGMEFGWSKIFESAEKGTLESFEQNSGGIEAFGQGVHALQDAFAHEGVAFEDHKHENDVWPEKKADFEMASKITDQAVVVHKLLSNSYKGLKEVDVSTFDLRGMTNEQVLKLYSKIEDYHKSDHYKKVTEQTK